MRYHKRMKSAFVQSIQVGKPQHYGIPGSPDRMDEPWESGFFKYPVEGSVRVSKTNLDGDGQADLKHHGGMDKAILGYAASHYPLWLSELDWPGLPPAAFGENLTIAGQTEEDVCLGDKYALGSIVLEVSQPRMPCWKVERRLRREGLVAQILANGRSGWYFRVAQEGEIAAGDTLTLINRPYPEWTIARANDVINHHRDNIALVSELVECPALAASLSVPLRDMVARKRAASDSG